MLRGWPPWRSGRRRRPAHAPEYVCVVDPGSTALRVLVVEVASDLAAVWGWDEKPMREAEGPAHPKGFEAALSRAEGMALDRTGQAVVTDEMVVGLPAQQFRGWAWTVSQHRAQAERPIERRELEAVLGRALRLAVNRLREPGERGLLLVDAVPVMLWVDGRGVTNPVGFRGGEIGATVFAALALSEVVESWRQVAQALNFAALTITAAPVALAASGSEPQGLVVDIGGATTDLTWRRAGRPLATASVPIGGQQVTQMLERTWGLPVDKAEALKRAYAAGQLPGEVRSRVSEAIAPAVQSWADLTQAALVRMYEKADEPLPHEVHVCGGGSALPEFMDATRSLVGCEQVRLDRSLEVGVLRPTDVPGVANHAEWRPGAEAVPVLALAAWAGRQQRFPDDPSRILSELCEA